MNAFIKNIIIALALVSCAFCSIAIASKEASASCYLIAPTEDRKLPNSDIAEAVLMRDEARTVLTIRSNYRGPAKDFALLVPVPQILDERQVRTVDKKHLAALSEYTSPILQEFHLRDPCYPPALHSMKRGTGGGGSAFSPSVHVEEKFVAGEYQVVILSASESNALEKWLLANKYNIPKGASAALASYIEQGQYFFVAKVDPEKVTFEDDLAQLSPLSIAYRSEDFSLPIRLGLYNSSGSQDLLVYTIAKNQRYQVANYPNTLVPTNLPVTSNEADHFQSFYEALFDHILTERPNSVVTEFAANRPSLCPGCQPQMVFPTNLLDALGLDRLERARHRTPNVRVGHGAGTDFESFAIAKLFEERASAPKELAKVTQCYALELESGVDLVGMINIRASVHKTGKLGHVEVVWDGIKNKNLEQCILGIASSWNLSPLELNRDEVHVELPLSFAFLDNRPPRDPFAIDDSWVVTRMRMRYSQDTAPRDLIFERAPPIRGGHGEPSGYEGNMRPTTLSKTNDFRARYVRLVDAVGPISCGEEPDHWSRKHTSTPAQSSARPIPYNQRPKRHFAIFSEVRAAARAQLEAHDALSSSSD